MHPSRRQSLAVGLISALWPPLAAAVNPVPGQPKKRVLIVSSYDRDYIWSQSTQRGVNAAMLKYGYLDREEQGQRILDKDFVESKRSIVQKTWMDTKRRNTRAELAAATDRIMGELWEFKPDIVLLGDDNAANFIGNQLLGSKLPVVFWGINGLPLKYGLIQNLDAPGSNITGVWQSGYYKESLELLKRLVPKAKTFAILACDSETTRPSVKMIEQLARRSALPLKLTESIVTNSFEEFKQRALDAAGRVDAFFVLNHDTLRDKRGLHVDMLTVGRWYLQNIRIPEVSNEDQFVYEGMLLTANDSGYNQGYLAFEMAEIILEKGASPARMAVKTPDRGPYLVNRNRAAQLQISLKDAMYLIDEVVDKSFALDKKP